ncbi:MAG: hypothetical protein AAFN07_14685 [Pseudomonadota bacterium]
MKQLFLGLVVAGVLSGCVSYTTPGGPAVISELASANINELMATEPAANFPARIAVVRVQAPGYESFENQGFGQGRYSVMLTRDVESDDDFSKLASFDGVAGVGTLNRLLLPTRLDSIESLREAAARLKADVLLLYTFDTTFQAGEQRFLPLNTVALGFLKNKKVTVTTTASAAMFDVRTEFLYGLAEATAQEYKQASVWGEAQTVDDLRVVTERTAFGKLVGEIEKSWNGVLREHAYSAMANDTLK